MEDIDGIYRSAIASEQLTVRDGGVEDLIKVVMARLSYERRRVEENEGALPVPNPARSTPRYGD